MSRARRSLSTGLASLDDMVRGLRPGDNIVWQVDAIEDYADFVSPYAADALRKRRRLVYFRFARHPALIAARAGAEIHTLSPELGFETFTAEIHKVIEAAGRGTFYIFDCLSDLAADWYSDLMLGNFFMVTCPYLYELETITYFGLLRDHHAFDAVAAIRDTTQLLLDVFRRDQRLYVHPLKVDQRHSPTMYLPHVRDDSDFRPVTESAVLAEVLPPLTERRVDAGASRLDIWDRKFVHAREVLDGVERGAAAPAEAAEVFAVLLRMIVTRDERLGALAARYLEPSDVLAIRRRMIGTGLVGGKSVGMLLARAILSKADPRWQAILEAHDSFFIGADVFYSFLVRNGCWHIRRNQRSADSFLDDIELARERILAGTFPPFIAKQFIAMLEYFGQSPIIVRSSSLLEDGFGNAFSGKYDSIFCPNQGAPEDRLQAFLSAVRTIYVSAMSREALLYRAHRGLLDRDEQMGILVQRVSGAVYGHLFYPQIAGVALSYNPFVWSDYIDPQAGMLRLVFGLGTRAVDRADDDYTRVVALNAPLRRPEASVDEVTEYAQHRVDVLDLEANTFASLQANDVIRVSSGLPIEMFASRRVRRTARHTRTRGGDEPGWVLTFERLLGETSFVHDMREMLGSLREAYAYPVDVEFTGNFLADGSYRINVVQCRPLQVKEGGAIAAPPSDLRPDDVVLEARGTIVGQSSSTTVDRLVYVVPEAYAQLSVQDRYAVARVIGRLTHADAPGKTVLLLGPGRWGTSTPELGVPVSFAEINTVSVVCEVVAMGDKVVPDVSLGTHFFNDLVEANMLYLAVFPGRDGNVLNRAFLEDAPNRLAALVPDDARWAPVVRVIDVPAAAGGRRLLLNANCISQQAVCYLAPEAGAAGSAPPAQRRRAGRRSRRRAG